MIIESVSLGGQPLKFSIPDESVGKSYFALSVHKAGSVLFEKVIGDICTASGRPKFDLEPQLFRQGVILGDCPRDAVRLLERPGLVFTGFRSPFLLSDVRQYRSSDKLLLVRDPRDIAVSFYFSMAKSHTVPQSGEAKQAILDLRARAEQGDVVQFILGGSVNPVFSNLTKFTHQVQVLKGFKTFRYEDIIFSKREWCAQIAQSLDIDLPPATLDQIADRHDVRPSTESPDQHVRQVTPGNYKKYLDERALTYIESRCGEIFDFFQYPRQTGKTV